VTHLMHESKAHRVPGVRSAWQCSPVHDDRVEVGPLPIGPWHPRPAKVAVTGAREHVDVPGVVQCAAMSGVSKGFVRGLALVM
jgi:hypothetical protein